MFMLQTNPGLGASLWSLFISISILRQFVAPLSILKSGVPCYVRVLLQVKQPMIPSHGIIIFLEIDR